VVTAYAATSITLQGTPGATVQAGTAYSFQPSASDSTGNALTSTIANKPAWATFGTATGALSGTPTTAQARTYANVLISASDGTTSASLPAFSITVTDAAGKSLTFSISNKPAWAGKFAPADARPETAQRRTPAPRSSSR
jgi:hypothetical protein